ncbi:MAG: SpvB/TcaC N-terminal domain-containing protein, partial [Angustibacter sp.]
MRPETGLENVRLPGSGGGIAPLGDRFQPDLSRGSGSYAVPLPCPKGPNDLAPALSLTYSTGSGNGPFGVGWRLNPMRIERRSDRGIPDYRSDEFTLGGAEILVEQADGSYRPRTDTQHWRIRRIAGADPQRGWQIEDGLGKRLILGATEDSREIGPEGQIFAWCLNQELDPAGNGIDYEYLREGQQLYCAAIRWSIWSVEFQHEPRPDVLRTARAGFLRSTGLRVRAIDLRCTRVPDEPLRTWEFSYQLGANGASQLSRIELAAGQGPERVTHPPLTFDYADFDPARSRVERIGAQLAPPPLTDPSTTVVDLDGDGLPDVLQLNPSFALRWRNTGAGSFAGPFRLPDLPSTIALSGANVALADLNADGRADLFSLDPTTSNWTFHADGQGGFDPQPHFSSSQPSVALADPHTRLTDLDGDGSTDLLWSGPDAFVAFTQREGEWQPPTVIPRVPDLAQFPDFMLGDQGVHLADMTGDGLADVVLIRSGEACYWPSLGGGSFGARITLGGAPVVPPGYREEEIHLVDLDGDGCADVVVFDILG